jgi:hypothetical protein
MLTEGIRTEAMAFASKFRKKWATDEWSYPLEWLVRNLILNEFSVTSVSPVGPKTRAHAKRLAAAQVLADADSLDSLDDNR